MLIVMAVALAAAVLAAGVVVAATLSALAGAGCAAPDIARKRPVAASSAESTAVPASAAVDGDQNTRWASSWQDPQWLQIDLGRPTSICQVDLHWENAYATAFDIQLSNDEHQWTTSYSTTTGIGGDQLLGVSGRGRYLRLLLRARATRFGYSLWEVDVHAGRGPGRTVPGPSPASHDPSDVLLTYRKPTQASSSRNDKGCPRCDPAAAVDLDPATRWATTDGASGPGWIVVDLGATAAVHRVDLQWGSDYAREYAIQLSPDGKTWTNLYHTSDGKGLLESHSVQGTGRYLRVWATAASSTNGYSLWEMDAYGTGGAPLTPSSGPAPPRNPATLVWSDEFNGPAGSPPDPDKWRPDIGPGVTGELEYNTDNKNAYQDGNGNLVMVARHEPTPGSTCPLDPLSGSTICQYTSARLNTHGTFSFTYGRVEARIKVSGTQGMWPAFWLLGDDLYTGAAAWPNCGEIDIMEHVGRNPNEISSTLHAPAYFSRNGIGAPYRIADDFDAGFHVYAADWEPDHITFSVDGTDFFTVDKETVEHTRGPWVFGHPFVMLLDNAIGGPFPGDPDARTVLPQQMIVDYVRVYQ